MGLLTGDNSINGDAPVVVMTTEVLRNMLYAGSPALAGLGYVVLDEVHYLADRSRGAVWEEVIIHLPESVRVVALSATVSNAEEFGDWLDQVRGGTDGHRGRAPAGAAVAAHAGRAPAVRPVHRRRAHTGSTPSCCGWPSGIPGSSARPRNDQAAADAGRAGSRLPYRPEVIARLDAAGLLPAITFIFSRAGCDAAVEQCLDAGLRLTTPDEAEVIQQVAERRTADIPPEDLTVLGYGEWLAGLRRGIAAHHAGMLPAFKEVVEELFAAGPGQGGLRHRDARARHQHAGPDRGHREAGQVERRDPRRPDAGGVHPAHRAGRAARHRRRGPRGGAVAARAWTRVRWPAWPAPAPTR